MYFKPFSLLSLYHPQDHDLKDLGKQHRQPLEFIEKKKNCSFLSPLKLCETATFKFPKI